MENQTINFDKLVNLTASLYYNKTHDLYRFQLGSVIFEVVEDENDGYRSSMEEVRVIDKEAPRSQGDFLAIVRIEATNLNSRTTWSLIDEVDNHTWLEFGTDNEDDYYPSFMFNYFAKPERTETPIAELIK